MWNENCTASQLLNKNLATILLSAGISLCASLALFITDYSTSKPRTASNRHTNKNVFLPIPSMQAKQNLFYHYCGSIKVVTVSLFHSYNGWLIPPLPHTYIPKA